MAVNFKFVGVFFTNLIEQNPSTLNFNKHKFDEFHQNFTQIYAKNSLGFSFSRQTYAASALCSLI